MRCKKHPIDRSSAAGVCASCLRQRLFVLIAAQAQSEAHLQAHEEDRRKSDTNPPPLIFPRSVSPYISRRKSDDANAAAWHHNHQRSYHHQGTLSFPDQKFFSTPQVGPTGSIAVDPHHLRKKKNSRFFLWTNLFRSNSTKTGVGMDTDPRVSESGESCSASAATASPSWFSSILPGRRRKQPRTFSLDQSGIKDQRRACRNRDRGMSPAMYSDDEENNEHCNGASSGCSSEDWKQTPRRTPAGGRRGGGRRSHNLNVSGIAFCLSPLVRASPSRLWNHKGGIPPEVAITGEMRVAVKPHHSAAAFFCKNRSRKLADFGRSIRNR